VSLRGRIHRPRGGLWDNGDFMKLWSSQTVSQFGTQVTQLALPLIAIIVLEASVFEVALVGTIAFLPFALFALPAGVWVDRLPRKPILIVGDVGRAVALVTVPLAYVLDVLTIWQLYGVAFATGVLTVFFDVAYQSYLPSLVERRQLVEGNSKLEVSRSGAQVAGPGVAGGLIELVTAPFAILVDAVSLALSALFVVRIKTVEQAPQRGAATRASFWREIGEGLRYVVSHPIIRSIAGCTAWFNLFNSIAGAVLLVYAVRVLGLTPGVIGVVFTLGSVGGIAGALAARPLTDRLGVGRSMLAGAMTGGVLLLIPLAPQDGAIPFLVASNFIVSFGVVVYNTSGISLMQAITPDRMLGRMNASRRFVVWGVIPLGGVLGGALGSWIGLREALFVGGIGNALAFLPLLLSSVPSLRTIPEGPGVTAEADALVAVPVPDAPAPATRATDA
jgi:MFS family permease